MHANQDEFERRTNERYEHRGYCTIVSSDASWTGHVLNLSESGALVAVLEPHDLKADESITLNLELETGSTTILHGRVVHLRDHLLGLECSPHTDEDMQKLREFLQTAGLPIV